MADLLVRGGCEDHVPFGLESLPGERRECHRGRCHLTFHVERATPPDLASAKLAGPWADRPLRWIGEHGVRMGEKEEARSLGVSAADPRDEVRPLGNPRMEPALDPERLEPGAKELGRPGLVSGRIDGVDANEVLEQLRHLVAQGDRSHRMSILSG